MTDLFVPTAAPMAFKRATRVQSKLKIGIQGPSGSGKTAGALRIAKGLVPGGRIAFIDTEHESSALYADKFEFDMVSLEPPYTSKRFQEAIMLAVTGGYDVLIIDSLSHQWAGKGGILARKEAVDARGGNTWTNWAAFTKEHEEFKAELLHAPIHIIACLRTKQDYILETNDKGKQQPKKVGLAAVQREGMEYEFTLMWELQMDHRAASSKDRTELFDTELVDLFDPETPKRLRQWLMSGKAPVADPTKDRATPEQIERLLDLAADHAFGDDVRTSVETLLKTSRATQATVADWIKRLEAKLAEEAVVPDAPVAAAFTAPAAVPAATDTPAPVPYTEDRLRPPTLAEAQAMKFPFKKSPDFGKALGAMSLDAWKSMAGWILVKQGEKKDPMFNAPLLAAFRVLIADAESSQTDAFDAPEPEGDDDDFPGAEAGNYGVSPTELALRAEGENRPNPRQGGASSTSPAAASPSASTVSASSSDAATAEGEQRPRPPAAAPAPTTSGAAPSTSSTASDEPFADMELGQPTRKRYAEMVIELTALTDSERVRHAMTARDISGLKIELQKRAKDPSTPNYKWLEKKLVTVRGMAGEAHNTLTSPGAGAAELAAFGL